jgi:hypothetical protein
MSETLEEVDSQPHPEASQAETPTSHPASTGQKSMNAFEPDGGSFPKKLLFGVGAIILVGLCITAVMVHASLPGWPGLASPQPRPEIAEIPEPFSDPASEAPVTPPPTIEKSDALARSPRGQTCIVIVPSAGLRSGPSLNAKALKAVVKQNERVTVLKRHASNSGPDWVQIETSAGRTGWVWASVVKEGKGRRRT